MKSVQSRPFDMRRDLTGTLVGIALGVVVGFAIIGLAMLFLDGFWRLLAILLPLFLLQLLVELGMTVVVQGLHRLWCRVRRKPLPRPGKSKPEPMPFVRYWSFAIGLCLAVLVALVQVLAF